MNVTDLYSPYLLRFAIEKELLLNNDPKVASITALKRLKKDPEYYHKNYGYIELQKAKPVKKYKKLIINRGK